MPPFQVPPQAAAVKARHSRDPSGASSPRAETKSAPPRRVHYNVIVRCPFPRGDFADPPQVDWDVDKDRRLWGIIANNPKIDNWDELAQEFDVPLPFMLQQAAWLYQRHMDSVREQIRKVGASSNASTPTPGGVAMKRLGSGGASRAPSQLSIRSARDSPIPRQGEMSGTGTPRPGAPGISRTPSTNTVTQSRHFLPSSPRQPHQSSFRAANVSVPRKLDTAPLPAAPEATSNASSPASSSSSESSSSDESPIHRSHVYRRPQPRFQSHKKSALGTFVPSEGEEGSDDEDSPTFLPSAVKGGPSDPTSTTTQRPDPTSTLRDPGMGRFGKGKAAAVATDNYDESSSPDIPLSPGKAIQRIAANLPTAITSTKTTTTATTASPRASQPPHGPDPNTLSPPHRADRARISPRKSHDHGQASDGTPSMGSSFSDLEGTPTPIRVPSRTPYWPDMVKAGKRNGRVSPFCLVQNFELTCCLLLGLDTSSVTQSALEEELASNLRHGGASRLSSFGNALRSRYLG